MPPLPSAALARGGLERVWHVLRQELRLDDKRRKLQQLADSLTHDSMAVRWVVVVIHACALSKTWRSVSQQRRWGASYGCGTRAWL